MLLGFILGVVVGVISMAAMEIYQCNKEFEEELEKIIQEATAENYELFTYDCLNDPDPVDEETSKHIPSI